MPDLVSSTACGTASGCAEHPQGSAVYGPPEGGSGRVAREIAFVLRSFKAICRAVSVGVFSKTVMSLHSRPVGESEMKTAIWYRAFFAGLVGSAFIVSGAFAQERVIEEELILKDPTVAERGKFLIGGAADLWYVRGPLKSRAEGRNIGTIEGSMVGGSGYLGYDNFTLMLSYKQGDFESDLNKDGFRSVRNTDRDEFEIKLRWMFRETCFPCLLVRDKKILGVVPYVMAGYNRTKLDVNRRFTTLGIVFVESGSDILLREFVYDSGLVGVGGILPFGDTGLGIRADVSAFYTSLERTTTNPAPGVNPDASGTGIGGQAHLTGYWNIYKGFNLQAGAKYSSLNGGDAGRYDRVGFFAQVGYTHRF